MQGPSNTDFVCLTDKEGQGSSEDAEKMDSLGSRASGRSEMRVADAIHNAVQLLGDTVHTISVV